MESEFAAHARGAGLSEEARAGVHGMPTRGPCKEGRLSDRT